MVSRCLPQAPSSWKPGLFFRQGADREGARPIISPQTSYRLDNRNYTGGGKESDEHPVPPQE
jgi:hypothetical protein